MNKKKKIFFHIGYPKTATIFLQKNFFSKADEVNFFCRRFSNNDKKIFEIIDEIISLNDIEFLKKKELFKINFSKINFSESKINLISDQNILCHKFRENNNIYKTLVRIKDIFKRNDVELVIFFSVREQRDAIISIYRQFYYSYFKKVLPELNNIFNHPLNSEIYEILESLKYFKLLSFIKKNFGDKNVKIFSYELTKNEKILYFSKICEFLNINKKIINNLILMDHTNKFLYKRVSLRKSIIFNLKNFENLKKNFFKKIWNFLYFIIFEYIQGKLRLYKLSKIKFSKKNEKKILDFYKSDNLKLNNETNIIL